MMKNNQPSDLITVAEAQSVTGVSHAKMAQLIRDGVVRYFPNPLDRREKLISKKEVLALIPRRAEAA
jgi:predicted DNA-binding transcriptional regulator AlpA